MGQFSASIRNWRDKTDETLRKIAATAIQDVMADAQTPVAQGGNMPVDTSFLRNSLASSVNGANVGEGAGSYSIAIAKMELGDTLRFAWTAEYAMRLHYGFSGDDSLGRTYDQAGNMWVEKAAQRWQQYVDNAANRFKT